MAGRSTQSIIPPCVGPGFVFELQRLWRIDPWDEPPRVYRRVKYSKDEPYDEPEIHPCLSC